MQKGDKVEVYLHDMSHDGRAVGRLEDGMTVFVHGGIIGQTVLVEITEHKKRMAEAYLLDVLETSSHEVPAPCKHADICGGCPWMGIAYETQVQLKESVVRNALVRIGHFGELEKADSTKFFPLLSSLDRNPELKTPLEYRNKMEFAFTLAEDGHSIIGLRKRHSHEIVEVTECLLQRPISMRIVAVVRKYIKSHSLGLLRYLIIRTPRSGMVTVECVTHPYNVKKDVTFMKHIETLASLVLAVEGVSGFFNSVRKTKSDVAHGEYTVNTWGQVALRESLTLWGYKRKCEFSLGSQAFFQVNTGMTEMLYAVIYAFAKRVLAPTNNQVWDVHCGVGSIGICLANLCAENDASEENVFLDSRYKELQLASLQSGTKPFLLGIESVASAIEYANKNAKKYSYGSFVCDDAKNLGKYFRKYDVPNLLILDPPRKGLDTETVEALLEYLPPWCIFVSCHPSTLARDISLLAEHYELCAVQAVDLFPHSPHVESVVLLQKK